LFFGQLRQRLDCSTLAWTVARPVTINQLKRQLLEQGQGWLALGEGQVLSALNHTLCDEETLVQAGDEVAFFPPVTGG